MKKETLWVLLAVVALTVSVLYVGSSLGVEATVLTVNIEAYPTYASPISDLDFVCTTEVTHRNLNMLLGETEGYLKVRTMTQAQHRLKGYVDMVKASGGNVASYTIRHEITVLNQAGNGVLAGIVLCSDFDDKSVDLFISDSQLVSAETLQVQVKSQFEIRYSWQGQERTFNRNTVRSANAVAPSLSQGGTGGNGQVGGDSYYYYYTPDPSSTAPPSSSGVPPSSLYVTISPNPSNIGGYVSGTVTSDGSDYAITVHAKHVGKGVEQTFGGRLRDDGHFYHGQTVDIPGYWDFWVTSNNGVSSNTPRLTVEGAMLVSDKVFASRMMGNMQFSFELYCHSAGTATMFVNDGSSSTPIGNPHVNSGGYASFSYDFSSWSLGVYEVDFVVNGIKASDYGESITITLGR